MFRRSLSDFAAGQGYNFSSPSVELQDGYAPIQIAELGASGPAWRWNENLGLLEQQLRAATQFGLLGPSLA